MKLTSQVKLRDNHAGVILSVSFKISEEPQLGLPDFPGVEALSAGTIPTSLLRSSMFAVSFTYVMPSFTGLS